MRRGILDGSEVKKEGAEGRGRAREAAGGHGMVQDGVKKRRTAQNGAGRASGWRGRVI